MLKNAVFKIGYDWISIIIRKSCIYNVALCYIYIQIHLTFSICREHDRFKCGTVQGRS